MGQPEIMVDISFIGTMRSPFDTPEGCISTLKLIDIDASFLPFPGVL